MHALGMRLRQGGANRPRIQQLHRPRQRIAASANGAGCDAAIAQLQDALPDGRALHAEALRQPLAGVRLTIRQQRQ